MDIKKKKLMIYRWWEIPRTIKTRYV